MVFLALMPRLRAAWMASPACWRPCCSAIPRSADILSAYPEQLACGPTNSGSSCQPRRCCVRTQPGVSSGCSQNRLLPPM